MLVILYFWWRNTQGMHESSSDALHIMQITTVMVVMLLLWAAFTLLTKGGQLPETPTLEHLRFSDTALGWLKDTRFPAITAIALLMESYGFYGAIAELARLLAGAGVPVLVAATANLRAYRDRARAGIPRFLEVFVDCPLAVCRARDPKGIYRRGAEGTAQNVPGVSAAYEPPLLP